MTAIGGLPAHKTAEAYLEAYLGELAAVGNRSPHTIRPLFRRCLGAGLWYHCHMATAITLKTPLIRALEALPESATWEDVYETIRYWEAIERGLADLRAGREKDHNSVMHELGLDLE